MIKAGAEVESGKLMCTALSEYPDLFDKKTLVLLNVGEETSSLDKTVQVLVRGLGRRT